MYLTIKSYLTRVTKNFQPLIYLSTLSLKAHVCGDQTTPSYLASSIQLFLSSKPLNHKPTLCIHLRLGLHTTTKTKIMSTNKRKEFLLDILYRKIYGGSEAGQKNYDTISLTATRKGKFGTKSEFKKK